MTRRLLESAGGAIERLLLFVPTSEARQFAAIYVALIDGLPADAAVALVVERAALPLVADWPCDTTRLAVVDAGDLDITAWARDPLLAADDGGESVLLLSSGLDRRDDLRAAERAADVLGLRREEAAVSFEGGNLLVGRDFLLVGADTLGALGDDGAERLREWLATFERRRREVIVLDAGPDAPAQLTRSARAGDEEWEEIFHYRSVTGTRQPIFHIDMFVTLAGPGADGRERVLVGDPALAARTLGTAPHPLCPVALFDAVADELAARGFAVTRNPLPMIYMDEPERRRRLWIYASSNNALVQRGGSGADVVWLPAYGHDHWPELVATDRANRSVWQDLGFRVRTIPQAQRLAENLGGLHCLTNVLRRGRTGIGHGAV